MNLIIVESPTKARTLSRFLGSEYRIEPTMGHIRDLPEKKLGIDVDHDFAPHYVTVKNRRDQIKQLQTLARKAQSIILATDPDREGEAIAYHVASVLNKEPRTKDKKNSSKFARIVFHEITQSAIQDALLHPRALDTQLVDAQVARRVLDRLVGYKLSPLLWYKVRKGLSAGRVQSVALRLIVEREREIEAFTPVEFWLIEAELRKNQSPEIQSFIARLIEKDGKKLDVSNKTEADSIVADLEKAHYVVKNIDKKEVRRHPYPPFTTSTLQQAASNRLGWTAKKTMQIAQSLYEEGYITYHRTDSTNLSTDAITSVREFISSTWGNSFIPDKPNLYKTKSKVAQEAHEAIRPTNSRLITSRDKTNTARLKGDPTVKLFPEDAGRDATTLYLLIWKRFVACQMNDAVYDQTGVDIIANQYRLRANGSIVKFIGWQTLYQDQKSKIKDNQSNPSNSSYSSNSPNENRQLPPLEVDESLDLIKLLPQQKFTQASPRYNEASLIKILEEKGIGRPSTYAPIISTLTLRQYVEKQERRFIPTVLGTAVNDFLVANFPDIIETSFTAKMEDELDSIARGEVPWVQVIRDFYTPFNTHLTSVYKEAKRVKIEAEITGEPCPTCGKPLVVRIGKYGRFIACSTYPECKYTAAYLEKAGITCPKCGGDIIIKQTKRGKRFYGCSNYPTCTFAAWKKEEITLVEKIPSTNSQINPNN